MDYKKIAQQLGSLGGKKSVKTRFSGKTKKEISEQMKRVRNKQSNLELVERTFKAKNYHQGSIRDSFNESIVTSEFLPEFKYAVVGQGIELMLLKSKEDFYKLISK